MSNIIPYDVDFVYVDGDHSYDGCMGDLEKYWPKTKIIGGHDYKIKYPGVVKAVNEFTEEKNIKANGRSNSEYWMVKNVN